MNVFRWIARETETRKRLTLVREQILAEVNPDSWDYRLGIEREDRIERILESMKRRLLIRGYVRIPRLSQADLIEGIDFLVVVVGETRYKTVRLSVTGERWAEEHFLKHPSIPVISVSESESDEEIETKIFKIIRRKTAQ